MAAIGRILVILALLAGAATVQAQTQIQAQTQTRTDAAPDASPSTPAAPPGMSQQEFDALVDAISNSVAARLKAEGAVAEPAAKPAAAEPQPAPAAAKPAPAAASSKSKSGKSASSGPKVVVTPLSERSDDLGVFIAKARDVIAAVPELGRKLASIPPLLNRQAEGGRSTGTYLLILGMVAAAAVIAEGILRQFLGRLRARQAMLAAPELGPRSLGHLALLALLDGVGVLVVWLICNGATDTLFAGATGQDRLAEAVLSGIFAWRLYLLLFRIILQPDMPPARLCEVEDGPARGLYLRIAAAMLLAVFGSIVMRVLIAIQTPPEALSAWKVLGAVIYVAAFLWVVLRSREAARQWFAGLARLAPAIGAIGRHWVPFATVFFLALGVTQIYGAIAGRPYVSRTMLLTLILAIGVLVFETLMQAVVRRLDSMLAGGTPASAYPKLPDIVARCIRVAVIIGVAVTIAESWMVQVFALVSEDEWGHITRSSRTAAITLFLAYVLWEFFKYTTDPYMGQRGKNAAQAIVDGDAAASPASRISTIMPLLRIAMAVLIAVVAVMIAVGDFGVDITPLIAGASVFGIAISFGSQTLVKDIVSGIFYLTDDAFRVGEYIDCGKAKGTVEGFTLRSIKLRHQNGQVHTIPFGQLGQITNFSRDWITVKFNLRFARDTDIEVLRKAAKKIGQDMMEMPEIKSEVLAPFKMQGVADIAGNALLIRFKFTARPGNPAMIQREAMKRMFRVLPELGIKFAVDGATVVVQTPGQAPMAAPEPQPAAPEAPSAPHPDTAKAAS